MPFYSKQCHAAYELGWVKKVIEGDEAEAQRIKNLYGHAGTFEVISNYLPKGLGEGSRVRLLALVGQNIVQRGIPTLAPRIVEELLPEEEISIQDIEKSLVNVRDGFAVDMRQGFYQKNYDGTLTKAENNNTEVRFWQKIAGDRELAPMAQFMEPQKPLEHVVRFPNTEAKRYSNYTRYCLDISMKQVLELVAEQRLDYGIELPRLDGGANCAAVELDGPTHQEVVQKSKDKMRDDILHELCWQDTVRIRDIEDEEEYRPALLKLWEPMGSILSVGRRCVAVSLPVKIAQMARTILMLVEQGELSIYNGSSSCIDVEEHTDKRIALYGIQNACNILHHLGRLLGSDRLRMSTTYVRFGGDGSVYAVEPEGDKPEKAMKELPQKADCRIGEQLDRRIGEFAPDSGRGHKVWLYAAYGEDSKNIFHMEKPLTYGGVDENVTSLRYFLYDFFRKEDFRPKQADIIGAALKRTNVIGLLPTGSGKTLTYQLSVLLQPGIGLVVAPLISLMMDQVTNLQGYGIDACATINGTISGADKRLLMKQLADGEFLFMYIAPERLQIKAFKELYGKLRISTLVMDEAHCVSQWGHDFRTAYLRVGETMERCMKDYITMALTGTASCNVITDIKRELSMSKNVAIVTPSDFHRPELHFKVLHQSSDKSLEERIASGDVEEAIKATIEYETQQEGMKEVESGDVEDFFRRDEKGCYVNSGLVFCPLAKKERESTETIYARLSAKHRELVGMYHGQLDDNVKTAAQSSFVGNKKGLLVATKAFGMGIDKPNIRFTVHTTVPDSIESFYQEAGRAGRDRKDAVNIIMAPPRSVAYEDIHDKGIFDFFISQSFPDQDAFVEQVANLLDTSYVKSDEMKLSLLKDLQEQDISSKEVDIDIDSAGHVVLKLLKGSSRVDYNVDYQEGKVKFSPKYQYRGGGQDREGVLYNLYRSNIQSCLKEKLEQNDKLTADNMSLSFDLEKKDVLESISSILRRIKGEERVDCYIGLDKSYLANWVMNILRYLIDEKKRRTGGKYPITLRKELWRRVDAQRKACEEQKWRYKPENFYPLYGEICASNRLVPLAQNEYMELAENLKPMWKGAYNGIQDKALYYLGVLGIYEDYERSYSPDYVKITLKPVDVEDIKEHIRRFISSYETSDYVKRAINLDEFGDIKDPAELVFEAAEYIISYAYDKIKSYRLIQSEVMYRCIQANDPKDDRVFMDAIYKYFESKYSEELLKDVEHENLNLPMKWIERIEREAIAGEDNLLEDLSHLRTSALKVEEARPQAYTPYLLYAYATFMDHNLEIKSGISAYLTGREKLSSLRTNYRKALMDICKKMLETDDEVYLKEVWLVIDNEFKGREMELKEMRDTLKDNIEKIV